MIRMINSFKKLPYWTLGRLLFCVYLGLCLTTVNVWGQSHVAVDGELNELHIKYMEQFWSHLETSQHTRLQTASAIRLLHKKDPSAIRRGIRLITGVLNNPGVDPASLWVIASDCHIRKTAAWCGPGGAYEKLLKADQENAAVLMLGFNLNNSTIEEEQFDTEQNQQMLHEAANAKRFDIYWGWGRDKLFEEALKFVEDNPVPPIPSDVPIDLPPHAIAYVLAMAPFISHPLPAFGKILELCRIQGRNQSTEAIESCKKLARTMMGNSDTMMAKTIGHVIEEDLLKIIDPDDPRIRASQLRKQASWFAFSCFLPPWAGDPDLWSETDELTMMNLEKNLSELGEWDGHRMTAIQEYKEAPENYTIDPADCDAVLELDEKELETLLGNQPGSRVWRKMQADLNAQEQQ